MGLGTLRNKFLVVVDDTPESRVALRFACLRALHTSGGVVLLRVLPPGDFQHWMAVEKLMRQEARDEAETLLSALAQEMNSWVGMLPEFRIREGIIVDEILALLEEEPEIRILVLGASPEQEGPGPLVIKLAGQLSGSMRVPVTVVPGNMSIEQIEALA